MPFSLRNLAVLAGFLALSCAPGKSAMAAASAGKTAVTDVPAVQKHTKTCFDFSQPLPKPLLAAKPLGDEFTGPFPSWSNLKRDFGAKGDGSSDDTNAVQAAFDALSMKSHSPVLFIPRGTYLIKKTVWLKAAQSIAIIGENPADTTLKWAGPHGGTLLHINGVSYSRFDRLTFDGAGAKGIVVDQSSVPNTPGAQFDTGNEYTDDVFENGYMGIRAGEFGGAAETSVLRSRFLNNDYGIALRNFNALDWWVWYSYFARNNVGITNTLGKGGGAGNFHAFNNVFQSSGHADLQLLNTGVFNFRDNFSIGSPKFLEEQFYYTNAAVTTLQHNIVITAKGNDCGGCSVYQGNMGPTVMTDNVFVSPPDATGPAILITALDPPDCLSVHNTFTNPKTIECKGLQNGQGRLISVGDRVTKAAEVDPKAPAPVEPLPSFHRRIFEVPPRSGSDAIQKAIDEAAHYCGQRPVVHLAYGPYGLGTTVTMPANCDIQLVGDGGRTALHWMGLGPGPALLLAGPSRAILREFYLDAGNAIGIEVKDADQKGARVYMQQIQALRSTSVNLLVNRLDNTLVELQNFQLALTSAAPGAKGVAFKVVGGPLAQQGHPQDGRTNLLAGSGGANYLSFQVSGGADVLVRDAWFEGTRPFVYAQVSDNSTVTFEGSRMATSGWAAPTQLNAVQVDNLSCAVTVLSSASDSDVGIKNSSSGSIGILGNNFGKARQYVSGDGSVKPVFALNRYDLKSYGSKPVSKTYAAPTPTAILTALAQSRATHPSDIEDLKAGVTDARFYRVTVEGGDIGIVITR